MSIDSSVPKDSLVTMKRNENLGKCSDFCQRIRMENAQDEDDRYALHYWSNGNKPESATRKGWKLGTEESLKSGRILK